MHLVTSVELNFELKTRPNNF